MASTTIIEAVAPTVGQLEHRNGTITTWPATADRPEIKLIESDIEITYVFNRPGDFHQVNFCLGHGQELQPFSISLLDRAWDNFDAVQLVNLNIAEARLLREYLNRPEVARRLDQE